MDCDLQDPPEEIPELLSSARKGFDIVLTKRDRTHQSWLRRLAARTYFRVRNTLLRTRVDPDFSTLSVISRPVVDAFLQIGDRDRQYMLILHWLGFRRTVRPLAQSNRFSGRSSYTLSKLIRVGLDGMFFQTTVLLRWIIYLGFVVALAGIALAVALVTLYFVNRPPPGYTSLAVLILLVGGFIIMSTGVTGLYVGKIFEQVKGRPLYVIEQRVGEAAGANIAAEETASVEPLKSP
jgi:dolichol-phosphate mannosyltransferase